MGSHSIECTVVTAHSIELRGCYCAIRGATLPANCNDESVKSPPKKKYKYKTASVVPFVISSPDTPPPDDTWLPDIKLNTNDKKLLVMGKWLSDKHIMAAQQLLNHQFSDIRGLQPTIFCQNHRWDVMRTEGVQILNDSNMHWLCISTINCPADVVNIYDSIKTKNPSSHIKEQIAAILHSLADSIILRTIDAQEQHNGSDCGLNAIATPQLFVSIPPVLVIHQYRWYGIKPK